MIRNLLAEEVAEIARTTTATLAYWRHVGRGPRYFRVGRRVLYAADDVEAWLASAREDSAPQAG